MIFEQRPFGRIFRNFIRRSFRNDFVSATRQAQIWELLARDPERVQVEIEKNYALAFGAIQPVQGWPELLYWLAAHWQDILKLLISLLVILKDDEPEE